MVLIAVFVGDTTCLQLTMTVKFLSNTIKTSLE